MDIETSIRLSDFTKPYKLLQSKGNKMIYLPKEAYNLYLPKNAKIIGTGATSVIYKHKKKSKVYGITTDKFKIKWLQFNAKRFKFKLLKQERYINGGKVYTYEMVKLFQLTKTESKYIQDDVLTIVRKLYINIKYVRIDELDRIRPLIYNTDVIKEFSKITKCFKNYTDLLELDLHSKQFMKNKAGRIVIIDPVFISDVFSDIKETK